MFKSFLLTGLILFSLANAKADSSKKNIVYEGQSEASAQLSSTKTHTEYTYEQVWTTCSRQVPDGYETICHKALVQPKRRICERVGGHTVCHDDGGGNNGGHHGGHHGGGGYDNGYDNSVSCYSRQIWRTEYYSCLETVARPYQVFDYETKAQANIYFGPWPFTDVQPKAMVVVSLSDEGALRAEASSNSDRPVFIYGSWSDETRGGRDTQREVEANLSIGFRDADKAFKVINNSLEGVMLEDGKLKFVSAVGQNKYDYSLKLKLTRVRWFLLKDVVVLDKQIEASDFIVEEKNGKWHVEIDLEKWHKLVEGKKYKLEMELNLATGLFTNLLNRHDIPVSKAHAKLKQKVE